MGYSLVTLYAIQTLSFQKYVFVTEQMQGHLRVYDKLSGNNEINYQLGYVPDGIVMYDETRQPGNTCKCQGYGSLVDKVCARQLINTCKL